MIIYLLENLKEHREHLPCNASSKEFVINNPLLAIEIHCTNLLELVQFRPLQRK